MAYNDIRKLREQYVFSPVEDITQGDMSYTPMDEDYGGGYDMPNPYEVPRAGMNPAASAGMPQQASSGQAGMGAPPVYTPPTPESTIPRWDNGPPQTQASSGPTLQDTIDAINKVYTPETTDRDRLRKLMDAAPERQRPSFARAMVAAGLSLKAQDPVATSEKVLYAPHYRAMSDWKEKADPFLKTAELENRGNINERTLASNVVTGHNAAERIASQERIANEKNRIAGIRAAAYKLKSERFEIREEGDSIVGYGPNHERIVLGSSGGMDEAEKIALKGRWDVKAAEARGEAGVKIAQAKGWVVYNDPSGRSYRVNEATGEKEWIPGTTGPATKPGTTGAGSKTNTLETRRQINDALQDAYQTDETTRRFIKKTGDSTFTFRDRPVAKPADSKWWGPLANDAVTEDDVKAYDEFRKSIDPTYSPPVMKPGGIGGSAGSGKEEPKKAPGIGPTQSQINDWSGNEQGPVEAAPPAPKEATPYPKGTPGLNQGPVFQPKTPEEQKAKSFLLSRGLPLTPANIAHAIKTGRTARELPRR